MTNPFADHPTKSALWLEAEPYFPEEKPLADTPSSSAKPANSLRTRMLETALAQVHPAKLQRRLLRAYAEASGDTSAVRLRAEFEPGMALVPVSNPNSHDYPIGQVCVIGSHIADRAALYWDPRRKRIKRGNHLPKFEANQEGLRLATPDEYRKFLRQIDDKAAFQLLIHIAVGHVFNGATPTIWDPLSAADEALRRQGGAPGEPEDIGDIPDFPGDPDFNL